MANTELPPLAARCGHCGASSGTNLGMCVACGQPFGGAHEQAERNSRLDLFGSLRREMASSRLAVARPAQDIDALIAAEDRYGLLLPKVRQELVALFDGRSDYADARRAFIRKVRALEDGERTAGAGDGAAKSKPDEIPAVAERDGATGGARASSDHLNELQRLVELRRRLKADPQTDKPAQPAEIVAKGMGQSARPGAPRDPSQIAKYTVLKEMRRGGMGTLYLARDSELERTVVVKVIRADIDSPDIRERFKQEARTLSGLRHPNIVTVHDYGEFESQPYLVMEHIDGESLGDLMSRRAQLPLADRLRYVAELCAGMECVHRAKIVHRDLKPDNVMVDRASGQIKILDFGIARHLETGASKFTKDIGTPCYMAPEQITSGRVDPRTDVWAIGTILYELMTHERAFDGETYLSVAKKIVEGEPTPLIVLNRDLDSAVVRIVDRALRKDPSQRYQTVDELQRELEALGEATRGGRRSNAVARDSSAGAASGRPRERWSRAMLVAVVCALAIAWMTVRGCV